MGHSLNILRDQYQNFLDTWKDCQKCPLSQVRHKIVHTRGNIPTDILFIGEAPGPSEDIIGKPFVGPAGKLQDTLVKEASQAAGYSPKICYFNVVGCFPRLETGKKAYRAPKKEEVDACRERLLEFVRIAQPRIIITLGKISKTKIPESFPGLKKQPLIKSLIHPSAILHIDDPDRAAIEFKRVVNYLTGYIKLLTGEEPWPKRRPPRPKKLEEGPIAGKDILKFRPPKKKVFGKGQK